MAFVRIPRPILEQRHPVLYAQVVASIRKSRSPRWSQINVDDLIWGYQWAEEFLRHGSRISDWWLLAYSPRNSKNIWYGDALFKRESEIPADALTNIPEEVLQDFQKKP